ncbi:hypothetical protein J6590_094292, partial [Homalodisca vitripennis]
MKGNREKDKDDWDLPDKSFYWELSPTLRFHLDQEPGTLRMSDETAECYYRLTIMVRDSIHSLDISLSLVNLRATPPAPLPTTTIASGSMRGQQWRLGHAPAPTHPILHPLSPPGPSP